MGPLCVAVKPGACPLLLRGSLGPCTGVGTLKNCSGDFDCKKAQKCCWTGCNYSCKVLEEGTVATSSPIFDTPQALPSPSQLPLHLARGPRGSVRGGRPCMGRESAWSARCISCPIGKTPATDQAEPSRAHSSNWARLSPRSCLGCLAQGWSWCNNL